MNAYIKFEVTKANSQKIIEFLRGEGPSSVNNIITFNELNTTYISVDRNKRKIKNLSLDEFKNSEFILVTESEFIDFYYKEEANIRWYNGCVSYMNR